MMVLSAGKRRLPNTLPAGSDSSAGSVHICSLNYKFKVDAVAKPIEPPDAPALITRSDKFPRIQNSVRVERVFNDTMQLARIFRDGLRPPAFLCQADAVFAGDGTAI